MINRLAHRWVSTGGLNPKEFSRLVMYARRAARHYGGDVDSIINTAIEIARKAEQ